MQPNKVLSKAMHVKPLQEGEEAVYKLIEADKLSPTHTDESGNKKFNSPNWSSARTTMVRDVETGEDVMIGCVVGTKPMEVKEGPNRGQIYYQDILGNLKFKEGYLRIPFDQFGMYQLAERHNANADNPFRDPKKAPKYYRVDPRKKAVSENNKKAVLADALSWINTCDATEIKAINKELPDGFKLDLNQDYEVIKSALFDLTMKEPIMVMKASNNKAAIIKIQVMEAEKFSIIIWDEEKRKWFYNEEKMEDIAEIEIGKTKIDGLVEFFKADDNGRKMYKRMTIRLKKFLNIGSPN